MIAAELITRRQLTYNVSRKLDDRVKKVHIRECFTQSLYQPTERQDICGQQKQGCPRQ